MFFWCSIRREPCHTFDTKRSLKKGDFGAYRCKISFMDTNWQDLNIILGSESPRRADILRLGGYRFVQVSSELDEERWFRERSLNDGGADMSRVPEQLARAKLVSLTEIVAARSSLGSKQNVLLCADTMILFQGQAYGKPKDYDDAYRMLTLLSGRRHQVVSGIALTHLCGKRFQHGIRSKADIPLNVLGHDIASQSVVTEIQFKSLSSEEIHSYLARAAWRDKAGSYGIQEEGRSLVESIEGSFLNVVGLPLFAIQKLLREVNTSPSTPNKSTTP